MDDDLKQFIWGMPKAELHVHLEGCLTPSLALELSERNNVPLPESIVKSASSPSSSYAFSDLTSFLAIYYPAMTVLQTSSDFHDLALDYFRRAHVQNVVHVELFFDPQAHTSRGVPFPVVIEGYHSAILAARREYGISASLIMCFLRDMSAEFAMATLLESLPYRDMIVGVGLDSDERDNPPLKFKHVFARARQEGYLLTMHCDVDQTNSIEHIRQAVAVVGVDRIDHGTNVVEDDGLVEEVRRRGIGLTCCPISNGVVTKDFKGKEMIDLLRRGVRVTINSDDPAYFRGYVNENIEKLVLGTDVTKQELVALQRNAIEISWIGTGLREKFLEELEAYARGHGL